MKKTVPVVLFLLLSLSTISSYAGQVALTGPQQYQRTTGSPNVYEATFLAIPGAGTLLINNGDPNGIVRIIAVISVNGKPVVKGSDFDLPYTTKAVPVTLNRNNTISIELRGEPKNFLTITVTEEIECIPLDQCHVAGTWDRSLGQCTNPAKADGTTCSDGNACTQTDTCQSGVCVGSNPVICTASDQCHDIGVCNQTTGICSNPAMADGTICSDGNACTQTDTCQSGACVGTNPVVCMAQDQCHTAGTCDQATGICSNPAMADGTTCSDGNACTQTDTCQSGACVGTNPVVCMAQDQCHTAGTCNQATGICTNPAKADGTTCSDGNACTQTDICKSGACVGSNPVVCTAQDQCHTAGTCDPASGICSNPQKPNGTACNDGSACTQSDACQYGSCIGSSINCDDSNACTADSCNPASGCVRTDARTAIYIAPTFARYTMTFADSRVSLYETSSSRCDVPWNGWWGPSDEPERNYCGPTAAKNLLFWYGHSSDYSALGSEMRTDDWLSITDVVKDCACVCSPSPICLPTELACTLSCSVLTEGLDKFYGIGTSPDNLQKVLAKESPYGYQLYRKSGNPGIETFESHLREGNPIVVLIWTGSRLHWTLVTGTYDENGTTKVRFANHGDQTWDWFVHQWSFSGIDWPVSQVLGDFGIHPYTWMYYEKATILTGGMQIPIGQENALYSPDGRFMFFLDLAGHLVLYSSDMTTCYWSSGNALPNDAQYVEMQTDGNLVIYGASRNALWNSNTHDHPGAYLAIQNDGNVVIYDQNHTKALWSTHTCCH